MGIYVNINSVIDFFIVFSLVLEKCISNMLKLSHSDIWYGVNKTKLEFYSSNFTFIELCKDGCVFFCNFDFQISFSGIIFDTQLV